MGARSAGCNAKGALSALSRDISSDSQPIGDGPRPQALKPHTKKKTFFEPRRQSERVQTLWAEYHEKVAAYDPAERLYLDEMGAALNLTLECGRAPKGQRIHSERPTSQGERISTLGALSTQGIVTALCFEGTLNGSVFLYFLEHFLCPELKPGQVVIMDNASAHKVDEVAELIEGTGARLLYLPPYHPDLNPIEMAWSSIKHFLIKTQARTKDALYEALAKALNALPPEQAKAYFEHVGVCV